MSEQAHVIVVGAGIIGASIAWRLVDAGAKVTLIDAAEPGGIASPCSFGWTNATWGNAKPYYDLRTRSMDEWDRLAARLDGLPYERCGTLYIHFDRVDLERFYEQHTSWGYALEWITRDDIARLEPHLRNPPERALFAPGEGIAEADETARFFTQLCREGGAAVETGRPVEVLLTEGSRVTGVATDQGEIHADHVVIAAGAATADIATTAGIAAPLKTPPGLLVHTEPHAPVMRHALLTEALHIKQRADGVIVAGEDFGGGEINDDPEKGAVELMERIKASFDGVETVTLAKHTLGLRPTPEDGLPIIGAPPDTEGVTLAVMHSGVTLAPAVSLFLAEEILHGRRDPLLAPFGPERFAESVAA